MGCAASKADAEQSIADTMPRYVGPTVHRDGARSDRASNFSDLSDISLTDTMPHACGVASASRSATSASAEASYTSVARLSAVSEPSSGRRLSEPSVGRIVTPEPSGAFGTFDPRQSMVPDFEYLAGEDEWQPVTDATAIAELRKVRARRQPIGAYVIDERAYKAVVADELFKAAYPGADVEFKQVSQRPGRPTERPIRVQRAPPTAAEARAEAAAAPAGVAVGVPVRSDCPDPQEMLANLRANFSRSRSVGDFPSRRQSVAESVAESEASTLGELSGPSVPVHLRAVSRTIMLNQARRTRPPSAYLCNQLRATRLN